MRVQSVNLNLIPTGVMPIVHLSQYDRDADGALLFNIFNGPTPFNLTGCTATINGTKPDGNVYTYPCTVHSNFLTSAVYDQMTTVQGTHEAEIRLSDGDSVVGTLNFQMAIEKAGVSEIDVSHTDVPALLENIQASVDEAEYWAEQAVLSEAWAVGTKNGQGVPPTDPTYENNSKYWAEYAHAVSGINPMTASIMGIGKPDGYTAEVTTPGHFSAIGTTVVATVNPGGTAYTSDWLVDADDNVITPDSRRQYRVTVEGKTSLWWWTGTEYKQLAGGGHVVTKTDGTPMPQRANLELAGAKLTDDSASDTTKVEFYYEYPTLAAAQADIANIPEGARVLIKEADYVGKIDNALSLTSNNPVQNKVVTAAINDLIVVEKYSATADSSGKVTLPAKAGYIPINCFGRGGYITGMRTAGATNQLTVLMTANSTDTLYIVYFKASEYPT